MEERNNKDIVIIPAYNPDRLLVGLVAKIKNTGLSNIIVVNDGSSSQSDAIFDQIREQVMVLNHHVNRGKGTAIKTALMYIKNNMAGVTGIVVMDADGQHRPEDAIRLLEEVHCNTSGLVLGVRCFAGKIPFKSLFGNIVTKYVFRLFSGKWVSDTQTGLRAFSMDMVPFLVNVSGERYEYEMNVLLSCAKNNISFTEVPIETIYHDNSNSCSHFRAIRDSVRIYGNIFAFSGASFISFVLDYLLFFLLVRLLGFGFVEGTALIMANIGARMISAAFNYYLNSTFIFRSTQKRFKSIVSYAMLACSVLILNTAILYCLHDYLGLTKPIAKLITEMLLFVISYTVQKCIIFNKSKNKEIAAL